MAGEGGIGDGHRMGGGSHPEGPGSGKASWNQGRLEVRAEGQVAPTR